MSGGAKLLDLLLKRIGAGRSTLPREFGWGDTEFVGHAVRDASHHAKGALPHLEWLWRGFSNSPLLAGQINVAFLLKKYVLVEVLYRKYFFYELLLQYLKEHPKERIVLVADRRFADPYAERFATLILCVHWRKTMPWLASLFALITLPLLMPIYWRRKVEPCADTSVKGLVCDVENERMVEGYLCLLQPDITPTFVVAPEYRPSVSAASFSEVRLVQLGLSSNAYRELKLLFSAYGSIAARNFFAVSVLGGHLLRFASKLVHGRIRAPSGDDYCLLACEHHDLTKTIRNEFIRKQGGRSLLFPYSSLYVLRFYADEFFENYDYVFSPGRHYDDTLEENEATCAKVFPVGTFAIHKHGMKNTNEFPEQKLYDLKEFVGNDRVVTILCPGVCKPTYPSEVKLMQLAQALGELDGVKVIVRQKPFVPEPKYDGFYESFVRGKPSILLTGMEYELFDFLPITDLFVTTYSTSACELAVCGANVLFVDCLEQDDRFIFWRSEVIGSLLVHHSVAAERIVQILEIIDDDAAEYRCDMANFSEYIGYQHGDYGRFRENLLDVLTHDVGISTRNSAH